MKLLLVNPSRRKQGARDFWDYDFLERTLGVATAMPLWAPTVAAIAPKEVEVSIVDENIEEVNFDEKADLIGIGAFSTYIQRGYQIADEFRKRGKKVVIGGIHASMLPQEAMQHADSVVIGEAENLLKELISDHKNGNLKKVYRAKDYPNLGNCPLPRFDLLKNHRYSTNLIQTTRGCPFDCEFCSVKSFLGPKFRLKKIEQIVKEIEAYPREVEIDVFGRKVKLSKNYLFTDDNIVGDLNHAQKLFGALKSLKLPAWWCQASINVGRNRELLSLMKESGCTTIFIGFESIDSGSLNEMGKKINRIEEFDKLIETIHSFGIRVVGSFILGNDSEDETIFEKTVDFINRNNLIYNMINILTPLPGTRLFTKLEAENRILHRDWEKYDSISVCYKPKKIPPRVLLEGMRWVYQKIYSPDALAKRIKGFWRSGQSCSTDYEETFRRLPPMEKIFLGLLYLKVSLSAGVKGIRLNLNLLPDLLSGKGEASTIINALVFSDFAFSFPRTKKNAA
jgi:radical SAM superfamily enzyme YgiQ (UPF0313 family)